MGDDTTRFIVTPFIPTQVSQELVVDLIRKRCEGSQGRPRMRGKVSEERWCEISGGGLNDQDNIRERKRGEKEERKREEEWSRGQGKT